MSERPRGKKLRSIVSDVLASTLLLLHEGVITEKFENEGAKNGPQKMPPHSWGTSFGGSVWGPKNGPRFGAIFRTLVFKFLGNYTFV